MNNKETKESKAAFESMCNELVNLHAHWNTFIELFAKSKDRADLLLQTAGMFFTIVRNMLIDHVELTLAKFGDPKTSDRRGMKENLSLEQICSIVAERGDVKLCKELTASMARFGEYSKAIEEHRNKRIAHFDYRTHVGPIPNKLPDVTRKAIESAISELDSFMNKTSEILGQKTEYCFDPVLSSGADALVCFLIFGSRYDDLRRARKIPISDIEQSKYHRV